MTIILASASPRRAELLHQLQLEFVITPANIDETKFADESPQSYVQRVADAKANALRQHCSSTDVVIAADTTVCMGESVYGKPLDQADCVRMLASLSGQTHIVYTAVVVSQGAYTGRALAATEVKFRTISEHEANQYWQTGEPLDKAGAYAIQGLGAVFVESIRGSYSSVVGLPLFELTQLLGQTTVQILK